MKNATYYIFLLCFLLFLFNGEFVYAFDVNYTSIGSVDEKTATLKENDIAPDFQLYKSSGGEIQLQDFINRSHLVIYFWSLYSEPDRTTLPIINKIGNTYLDNDYTFILVNLDGTGHYTEFLKQEQLSVLLNTRNIYLTSDKNKDNLFIMCNNYGVTGTPTFFIINSEGNITFTHKGIITEKLLTDEINKNQSIYIPKKVNGKYGFVNSKGTMVINPIFEEVASFHNGLARAKSDGKWGFIDKTGKYVVDPKYSYAWDYSNNKAKVRTSDDEIIFINIKGEIIR